MMIRPKMFAMVLLAMLLSLAPARPAAAQPAYIWITYTFGSYQWKDLDGKCVAVCQQLYTCPCWPITITVPVPIGD